MPPVQVGRRYGEGELRESAQERLEGDVALESGQRRTETVMDAVPEREMTGLIPVEVELLGAGVSVRVPVRRGQADDDLFTRRGSPHHRA